MSIAKVILNCRPDIYVKMNSNFSVNLATFFAILCILIDMCIRIDMHIFNDCDDNLARGLFQFELQRDFCIPESYDISINSTLCEIYKDTKYVNPIGCKKCTSIPSLRILLSAVVLMESIKFFLGFSRNAKRYGKKFKKNKVLQENTEKAVDSKAETNLTVIDLDKFSNNISLVLDLDIIKMTNVKPNSSIREQKE
jgi:hypothetical protein